MPERIKVLHTYAGLAGTTDLWDENICEITHVEKNEQIAEVLQARKPKQKVVVADAHQYLLDHYKGYPFTVPAIMEKFYQLGPEDRETIETLIDGALSGVQIKVEHCEAG